MEGEYERVYQFKITLKGIRPPVWRRIQVPENYSFWDLHVAIQDVMGWLDYHLHEFELIDPSSGMERRIGLPHEEFPRVLAGWEQAIAEYFTEEGQTVDYVYDFGDNWEHKVELEKILPREENVDYPRCIKGKRACPPEDCGGVWGYEEFLKIIDDPDHEDHEEMLEWVGGEFDPDRFNLEDISFSDPDERLEFVKFRLE
ncbi:hypothetical protein AKJ39_03535 [candidate division MSBL1 archaeon SCGC-AAA259J03]|uniref:Plasmid pRiA4b Orf3-like domain-containing protein n=3 Tax=candidate division MSBL1 TaxID=215777 RepID=A0A656YVI8_9EURY|nr:hypothetical protein AKJ61_00180 [candidate division MSBL1 archaeon SCGC-AAA259B11]KXA95539.1 hypothetical protein AKJ36_00380 [candidate division MSBL1 archaeon SCGC-AAA259I07]KXA97244.1 hypothetical protein AKJ39_03535 [candidate division MSBL1 archaeon SCGC-AAA259J03]